ncbi:hypothetical protein ACVQK1_05585 [Edwardsiella tarda]
MPNPFDELASRMDATISLRFGKPAEINGTPVTVVPSSLSAVLGPVEASVLTLIVFSPSYRPHRGDDVRWNQKAYTVSKFHQQNGKWVIQLESG